MGLSAVAGFKLVMEDLGFIVICWNPESGRWLKPLDKIETIWGDFPAPEPLVCLGRAVRKDWDRQRDILLSAGLRRIPAIPKGWRISMVGRPDPRHVEPTAPADGTLSGEANPRKGA